MIYINNEPLYLTAEEYTTAGFADIPAEQLEPELRNAQKNIDILTFNRIKEEGFETLTTFQKGVVQEVMAELAGFQYENKELLEGVVSSYSLNGVSLTLENGLKISNVNGVIIKNDIFEHLKTTGLCGLKL